MLELVCYRLPNLERPEYLEAISKLQEVEEIRTNGEEVKNPTETYGSYTASGISSSNKWTEWADNCLAGVIAGQYVDGSKTSFMVHVSPEGFKYGYSFAIEYPQILQGLKCLTREGTRELLFAGGNRISHWQEMVAKPHDQGAYTQMRERLGRMHELAFGIQTLFLPPKLNIGKTNLYLNTDARKLYVVETGYHMIQPHSTLAPITPILDA